MVSLSGRAPRRSRPSAPSVVRGRGPAGVRAPLLQLEIVDVAGRRWSWDEAALVDLAAALDELGFELAEPDLERVARWTARGLTAYDGAYLAVAEALGTPLITDDDLIVEIANEIAQPLAGTRA